MFSEYCEFRHTALLHTILDYYSREVCILRCSFALSQWKNKHKMAAEVILYFIQYWK